MRPIWKIIEDVAIQLTAEGRTPFTGHDLVEGVLAERPEVSRSSVQPIIQGMTVNAKGGVGGAHAGDLLLRVGRGQFTLNDGRQTGASATEAQPAPIHAATMHFTGETALRDEIVNRLAPVLNELQIVPEGKVPYTLPDGTPMSHASDILVKKSGRSRMVSVELKYRSAVTDVFKGRAYDAILMKREHGDEVRTIMVFARDGTGIGIARARSICYPFDSFYGGSPDEILSERVLGELAEEIGTYLDGA